MSKTGLRGLRPGQTQKGLSAKEDGKKLEISDELYYPCSENKGADQLCSYCEANLHLFFRIGKNHFLMTHAAQFRRITSLISKYLIAIHPKMIETTSYWQYSDNQCN